MKLCKIQWHKLNDAAKIPTKRDEDAGFDIYTTERDVILQPSEKHLFHTGICYNISPGYWLMGVDRGSTGSKGIHIHCGVCDQGYRGEVFICLCNDNKYPVKFTDAEEPGMHKRSLKEYTNNYTYNETEIIDYLVYPTSKAIAQLVPVEMPQCECSVVDDKEWEELKNNSLRGETALGASGK